MSRLLLLSLLSCGCAQSTPPAPPLLPTPVSRTTPANVSPADALDRGVAYLVGHQSPDGRWRSDVYATFRDGSALTPLVVVALQDANAAADARKKGAATLAAMVTPDGTIDPGEDGLPYPVYTAALSVMALSHTENAEFLEQRDAWLKYLLDRQLTEKNGWSPEDVHYGGWGYYPGVPMKPAPGEVVPAQQLLESNLSATAFAVDALGATFTPDGDRTRYDQALTFVRRCKNADGGYHFVANDPIRNKAGLAEPGPDGEPRYHSYGSASADGGRAERSLFWMTVLCGNEPDPRTAEWLVEHFDPDHHPGDYVPAHESNRDAVYFYYAASAARTLRTIKADSTMFDSLAKSLAGKQNPDGSCRNRLALVREDDPMLATAYAVWALGTCLKPDPATPPTPRSVPTNP